MENEINSDITEILKELKDRLDLSNTPKKGNLYHKAYKVIEADTTLNGLPTAERAYHLCIVKGVPENEAILKEREFLIRQTRMIDHKGNVHKVYPGGKKIKPKQSQFGKKYF